MKILYINGSPRGEKGSTSFSVLKDLAAVIRGRGEQREEEFLTLPRSNTRDARPVLDTMESADIWIMAMPLYVDTLPSHVLRWLMEYQSGRGSAGRPKKVYAVVNSGFPEPEQSREALRVLEIFCQKNSLEWRTGIALGMGEPYKELLNIPLESFLKRPILRAYEALRDDLEYETPSVRSVIPVKMRWPVFLYKIQGNMGWPVRVKQNGMKRREIYARPLSE